MSAEQNWNHTPKGLLQPLEGLVKDFARNPVRQPNHGYLRSLQATAADSGVHSYESPIEYPKDARYKFYYVITTQGVANSRPDMGPNADGVPTEIELFDVTLITRNGERSLELADFSRDELAEIRDEIEQKINDGEI